MGLNYIKGVNLGNWLVLEKWMNPALFDGTTAADLSSPDSFCHLAVLHCSRHQIISCRQIQLFNQIRKIR